MLKKCISKDWKFANAKAGEEFANYIDVDLPHDYQVKQKRVAKIGDTVTLDAGDRSNGYYPDTNGRYLKYLKFEDPKKHYILDIDGAYMLTYVYFNSNLLDMHPYGYTPYLVELTPFIEYGCNNKIAIETRPIPENTRWYPGNGLYRDVFLWEGGAVRIEPWDMFISTVKVEGNVAQIKLKYQVNSDKRAKAKVKFTICYEGQEIKTESTEISVLKGKKKDFEYVMSVENPQLWDTENPNLYTLKTQIEVNGKLEDESENTFGIRTISASVETGLLLNGKKILLKGGCIHHDHGVLGAAAFPDAEYRKVKKLKDAGFNALRCAHNPPSLAFLEICDRLGMIVMDEAFDVWCKPKMPRDYNMFFRDWCLRDISYMVLRDRNHPCVFSYSIGNEIGEIDGTYGAEKYSVMLSEQVRKLDDTRFVTSGIQKWFTHRPDINDEDPEDYKTFVREKFRGKNWKLGKNWRENNKITLTYEKPLDIIGINYGFTNYKIEHEMYPDRVMWGSETHHLDAYRSWKEVKENNYVLGDFNWTAYDNMGEVGGGRSKWTRSGLLKNTVVDLDLANFPWRTCWQGDLDMCCNRRPQSYFRESIWDDYAKPRIFTTHPEHFEEGYSGTWWHFYDVHETWTFDEIYIGRPLRVETYTNADKVEWFVNDKLIGESVPNENIAFINTVYEPGEIKLVAYKDGKEFAFHTLQTTSKACHINLSTETPSILADNRNLCYVDINICDKNGRIIDEAEMEVTCAVSGGELLGIYGAHPANFDDFTSNSCHVYRGRALAVVRTKNPGTIKVTVFADGLAGSTLNIAAKKD